MEPEDEGHLLQVADRGEVVVGRADRLHDVHVYLTHDRRKSDFHSGQICPADRQKSTEWGGITCQQMTETLSANGNPALLPEVAPPDWSIDSAQQSTG